MTALALTISDVSIRQDEQGRYCLNDLHKASGSESRHQPAKFLENQQAIELVEEITKTGIPVLEQNQPVRVIKGGSSPGTFAVKEMVYAYAMWISAKFHLAVIRAYDALVTGKIPYGLKQLPEPPTITKAQQGILYNRVKTISGGDGKLRTEIWSRFQNHFDLSSYKDLPADSYDEALAYLDAKLEEYRNGVEMLWISRTELNDMLTDDGKYLRLTKDELNRLLDERVQVELKALASPVKEGEVLPKSNNTIVVDLPLPAGMTQLTYKFNTEGLDYGRWTLDQSDGVFNLRVMNDDQFVTSSKELPKRIACGIDGMIRREDLAEIIKSAAERL